MLALNVILKKNAKIKAKPLHKFLALIIYFNNSTIAVTFISMYRLLNTHVGIHVSRQMSFEVERLLISLSYLSHT